jgi:hypothetical protein
LDNLQLANQHLQTPYDDELVQTLRYTYKIDDDPRSEIIYYCEKMLALIPKEKKEKKGLTERFVQTILDAYR